MNTELKKAKEKQVDIDKLNASIKAKQQAVKNNSVIKK